MVTARSIAGLFLLAAVLPISGTESPVQAVSGQDLLSQADRFADCYNWIAAVPLYREAETIFRRAHDSRNSLYAHVSYLRGTMESRSLKDLSVYIHSLLPAPLVTRDPRLRLRCLIAKADADAEIDSTLAQADWEGVFKVAGELNDQKWKNRSIGEIGFHRYVQGDHIQAKKDTAIALIAAHRSGDYAAEIRFSSGIGTGLTLGGSHDEGLNYLNRAWDEAMAHPDTGYPYMTAAGKIMALLGNKDYPKAERLITDQIKHAETDNRLVKLTQARLFLADLAIGQHDIPRAIEILQETIDVAGKNHTRLLTEVYSKLTDLYREQGRLRDAEHTADLAISGAGEGHSMYLEPELLLTLARLKIAQHRDAEAERYFERATDVVEGMLAHTNEIRTRESLLTTMSYVYAEHFALAARHQDIYLAYSIIERVRGRIVSELILSKPEVKDLDELNPDVEDRITALKLRLAAATGQGRRQQLLDQLFFTEQARWVTQRAAQIHGETPIPLLTLRKALAPHEVLLEYVLGDQQSYCLLLSRSDMRLVPITAGRDSIAQHVKTFLANLQTEHPVVSLEQWLYSTLIAQLGSLRAYDHITVVADGALHLLPFEVLRRSDDENYLGLTTTLSYAPSAGSEYLLRTREHTSEHPSFLGIGGVPYEFASNRVKENRSGAGNEYDLSGLHELPGSEQEVRTAARLVGGNRPKLVLGNAATKTALVGTDLSQYSIIHFAVHALTNTKAPDSAALLLQSDPPKTDGFLEAREIVRLHLNSQLVVLSACSTATGRLQGEEGVSTLARAFLIAGSSSVISTLWPVDDTYSLFLMKRFYEHLTEGQNEANSLRAAKMDVLQTFGRNISPVYWAAFTLEGDGLSSIGSVHPALATNITWKH